MYCRKCGNELSDGAKFCSKCGTPVDGGRPAAGTASENRPVSTAKPGSAARPAAKGKSDQIDIKLIAIVAVVLIALLFLVMKVVQGDGGSQAGTEPPVSDEQSGSGSGAEESAPETNSYFGKKLYVGAKVEFGSYEQDGDPGNGPEPIEWEVVKSYEDGYILISRYILEGLPWDDGTGGQSTIDKDLKGGITYETCSMRRWIRDVFSQEAFTDEERSMIVPVSVKGDEVLADKNNRYATDYAYILQEEEVRNYFGRTDVDQTNTELRIAPTTHAMESGLEVNTMDALARHQYNGFSGTADWALRRKYTDESSREEKIVTVSSIGRFSNAVVSKVIGFRPVIVIRY